MLCLIFHYVQKLMAILNNKILNQTDRSLLVLEELKYCGTIMHFHKICELFSSTDNKFFKLVNFVSRKPNTKHHLHSSKKYSHQILSSSPQGLYTHTLFPESSEEDLYFVSNAANIFALKVQVLVQSRILGLLHQCSLLI